MAKPPSPLFVCSSCDAQFPKWEGRCSSCGAWSTLKEQATIRPREALAASIPVGTTGSFGDLRSGSLHSHLPTGLSFWDRLLSGGIVPGSVVLLGGEPGIGKSTVLAQLALHVSARGDIVLYVTGEESPAQVNMRLRRLSSAIPESLRYLDGTEAQIVAKTLTETKPALMIVDSIQTMRLQDVPGEPGNPTQIKASASVITEAAKRSGSSVILVGQVTKDGELAGPRLLEHVVDTVLMLEGDRYQSMRILRVVKHRFGNTEEAAILSMQESGLEEILDPSAALMEGRVSRAPGSVITCLIQGSRPVLVEIQALVTKTGYGTPSRRASGIDQNRLNLLLAVLSRRAGVQFADQDVFVNAVGGIDAKDTSIDLAIALALISAKRDIAIPSNVIAWGEVGLTGEVRHVPGHGMRRKEAERMGFTTLCIPQNGKQGSEKKSADQGCQHISDAIRITNLQRPS